MNNTGFSKRIEIAPILGWILSDDELAIRARSLLRWKIRYNSIHVEAEKGHVTLSGQVNSSSDRDAAEQIIRKLSGVGHRRPASAMPNCCENLPLLTGGGVGFDRAVATKGTQPAQGRLIRRGRPPS